MILSFWLVKRNSSEDLTKSLKRVTMIMPIKGGYKLFQSHFEQYKKALIL